MCVSLSLSLSLSPPRWLPCVYSYFLLLISSSVSGITSRFIYVPYLYFETANLATSIIWVTFFLISASCTNIFGGS